MRPVIISLSPNTEFDDVWLAFKTLIKPWTWTNGQARWRLKKSLSRYLGKKDCWLFNAGRSALLLALQSLDLENNDEVICQAFTCVAVPNAIIWAGAKPVYADTVKDGFNVDPADLAKKITAKTKAVIIQHTFGQADDVEAIRALCQKNKLVLIEDCAHGLGAKYKQKKLGSFGDMTMLSFGRDKVISSVSGGALLTSRPDLAVKIDRLYQALDYPQPNWVLQQLLHPIIFWPAVPLYFQWSLGKIMIYLARTFKLISLPVDDGEKVNKMTLKPKKMPGAVAVLAERQFKKLDRYVALRRELAQVYCQKLGLKYNPNSGYIRFSLLVDNAVKVIRRAKQQRLWFGDWFRPVIAPRGVDNRTIGYRAHSCPNAEASSQRVVNLPTTIKLKPKDAAKIADRIGEYVKA